jgi:hypothetical protein
MRAKKGSTFSSKKVLTHIHIPTPKPKKARLTNSTEGAPGGGCAFPDVRSYSMERSDDWCNIIIIVETVSQPINMYDLRRYPKIGKLSERNPKMIFKVAGIITTKPIVACCASLAPKSRGYTLSKGRFNPNICFHSDSVWPSHPSGRAGTSKRRIIR